MTGLRAAVIACCLAIGGGCATHGNTWQQEAAFELHRRCAALGAVHLDDVRPDGSHRIVGDAGSVAQYQRCVDEISSTPEWQHRLQEIKRAHDASSSQ